ncbi:GGDEF domain-containing protein [Actinomycetes bacterium KLBMP 9797]
MQSLGPAATRAAGTDSGADGMEVTRLRAQLDQLQAEREALRWAAGHDELTGLPNRRLFHERAPSLVDTARGALLVIDLDGFKPVNDTYGHDVGDAVLAAVGGRLAAWAGNHLVARLGGDEFAAVLTLDDVRAAVGLLAEAIAAPIPVADKQIIVTASIGVAPVGPGARVDELLRQADQAMYRAKRWHHPPGEARVAWVGEPPPDANPKSRARRFVELIIEPGRRCDPVAPEPRFRPGDRIWVHRGGDRCPGVVEAAAQEAVTARYRRTDGPGTVVDTVWMEYVSRRTDTDPHLDR